MTANSDIQKIKIVKERTELYRKFSIDLLYTISKYYLDKKSLNGDINIKNHYEWCYIKVCDKFLIDGYKFHYNDSLKNYFYIYYYENIYKSPKINSNEDINIKLFKEFWNKIFDISTTKDKNIIAILAEIYKIFDKSMSNIADIIAVEEPITLEKEKNNLLSKNFDKDKFSKIFEYKYADKTIALAELINTNLIFINKEGEESILNITDDEITNMDSYIRGIYFNQLINNKYFYTVTQFIYADNTLAKAETVKGKTVYINKIGESVKYKEKNI